jgi:signal transduction histidine kinase
MAQQPDPMTTGSRTENPQELRREIAQTRQDMGETVTDIEHRVHPRHVKERQMRRFRDRWTDAKEAVMGSSDAGGSGGTSVGDQASAYADRAKNAAQQAPQQTKQATRGNPLAAGLIALGAGALAGTLFPATDPERQAAGRLREEFEEPVRDELQRTGQDLKDGVQGQVEAARDDVKATAQQAAENVKQQAQQSKDEVRDHADQATSEVRQNG